MQRFRFPAKPVSSAEKSLRLQVRSFLRHELETGSITPQADCWVSAADADFSRKLGEQGWLGMTWPERYGGKNKSTLDRLIVSEELLLAGAPVAAHWIADRQSGAQILRFGTEAQKTSILPSITQGKCFFAIGMSEAQAGSDLAAVATRATKNADGWTLNGTKLWSTGAHIAHYMIVLARTAPLDEQKRHEGLSQFLVNLSLPGIQIDGIRDLSGEMYFNETRFDQVQLPSDALLGEDGQGWAQCMSELSLERSGPERYLTTVILLEQLVKSIRQSGLNTTPHTSTLIGRLCAHIRTLRFMSRGIALLLEAGESPETEAALVKDLGNRLEQDITHDVRQLKRQSPEIKTTKDLERLLLEVTHKLPSHTLRGGTTEIMRGIIARQLGVR